MGAEAEAEGEAGRPAEIVEDKDSTNNNIKSEAKFLFL